MSTYRLFTDANCDLPPELIQELDIDVIPMEFSIGDKTYKNYPDAREMSAHDFYERLRGGEMSTTNQITAITFTELFEPVLRAGEDILYLVFSSGLSGTCNNACMVAKELNEKYPDRKMRVVDSLAASMGQGLLIYHAALKRAEGADLDTVSGWLEENRNRLAHWFTVDDLNHLKRGGRVSGAAALVGTMLGIKPVLHVDDEGHLIPVEKIRGRRQSLDALVQHMEKTVENPEEQMIFVSHGDAKEDAEYVAEQVKEKFHVKSVLINPIGPVIGTHSGPGTIALFFLGKNKD